MRRKAAEATLLRRLQRKSFDYFLHESNPANGLVRDKTADGWPASIAAVGMALTAYPVGVERRYLGRREGVSRTLATLRFFARSEQSTSAEATGHRGFYYHFLEMGSGRRAWRSELSSIDTAVLIAGALAAAAYFDRANRDEAEIRALATMLYERIEWPWMLAGAPTLCHGWKPERGGRFLGGHWHGYDESLLLQVLALGSPTHAIGPASYAAWCRTFDWRDVHGTPCLHAGPLFIHQLSHAWIDFRGIGDAFVHASGIDYFENSRRAALIQQQHAVRNPLGWAHAGEHGWGLSASDGPGPATRTIGGTKRRFFDYIARGVPDGPDDGTLAPWVVAAALPFAPDVVLPTLARMQALDAGADRPHGFVAAFNPSFKTSRAADPGWVSPHRFGINEGPTVLLLENHRSGLIWSLMRNSAPVVNGLRAAGFTGGWLGGARG